MKSLIKTSLFFLLPLFLSGQNTQLDSLKTLLANSTSDTTTVLLYEKLMEADPNSKTAVEYGLKGFELARHIRFDKGAISCGNKTGFIITGSDYYKAVQILLDTKQICERTNNEFELAKNLAFLGQAYNYSDFETSIAYYRTCKKLMQKIKMTESVIPINAAMAYCFKDNNMPDSALIYLQKGYAYALKSPDLLQPNGFYKHFGEVYYQLGKIDSALHYFRLSILQSKNKSDASKVGEASYGIALICRDRNQIDSAKWYAQKALEIQQSTHRSVYIIKSANLLYELNKASNPNEAVKYQLIALTLKDSLFNQEKANQAAKFAYEQRDQEARTLRRIEAHQTDFQNKIKIYVLSFVLLGLSVMAFVFYRNNRQKQKANDLLENTVKELKATQNQLIQSEKLASLGELTAGIAHEIQNPLNFVNNFSELSVGIAKDLNDEINQTNIDKVYVEELLTDLISNQEKINHHGKRASSIVKGMLEHSRAATGVKEWVDVNKLCDEYFRLAFHGLRAKDKDFNCEMVNLFDESLPKIQIIPQDVGRVVLNLINNAFYAVNERGRTDRNIRAENLLPLQQITQSSQIAVGAEGFLPSQNVYQPTVTVQTHCVHLNNEKFIEIRIKDNGTGMPEAIKEKIFQPFFTTKPTGSGTGLGLSLAYDIITKGHGGKLTVESTEGAGSEFVIQLPA